MQGRGSSPLIWPVHPLGPLPRVVAGRRGVPGDIWLCQSKVCLFICRKRVSLHAFECIRVGFLKTESQESLTCFASLS